MASISKVQFSGMLSAESSKLLTYKSNPLVMCFPSDLLFILEIFQTKLWSDALDIRVEGLKFRKTVLTR